MNNIFNPDNFFFKAMTKLFDAVILSLVFALSCLPLFTIGPAITALYYATVKSLRRNRSYVVKEFFHSFKRDFKQSFLMELILLVIGIILYVDIKMSVEGKNYFISSIRYVYVIIGLFAFFLSIYAFPLISRFSLKMKELLKLSFFLSIRHLLTTIVAAILLVGAFTAVYITYGFFIIIVPVFAVYLISIMMENVLKNCMKMIGGDQVAGNTDEWYME